MASHTFTEQLRALQKKWQLQKIDTIQSLWSGYGEIARYHSKAINKTVIIKQVIPPSKVDHPRGWNTPLSHERKLYSYQAELNFYRLYGCQLPKSIACRVPALLDQVNHGEQLALLLEDIDAAGFAQRKIQLNLNELKHCLSWLAQFHGFFLHTQPEGLWHTGCYWHLNTRPDELNAMVDGALKRNARDIDKRLHSAKFQTLVHGDAKLANFCFSDNAHKVVALDFQYVGAGPGIKDVMLFLGSCLDPQSLFDNEAALLGHYFITLRQAVAQYHGQTDFASLEAEWRHLYAFAWADFHRFLAGWKPDHVKINTYMQAQTQKCLTAIRPHG